MIVLHRQNVRRLFAGTETRARPWRERGARGYCSSGAIVRPESLSPAQVELGLLLVAGPDNGLARVVNRVGQPESLLVRDARQDAGQGGCDAFERVVVVVEDDHVPRRAEIRSASDRLALERLRWGRGP